MAGIHYPPLGYHFRVDFAIPGLFFNDSRWMEVSGLSQEMSTESLSEGGINGFQHKLPTRGNFGKLTLKRGMQVDSLVILWIKAALDFQQYVPLPITVMLLNESSLPVSIWQFFRAFPTKYSISDLNAKQNEVVVETLELDYAYFIQLPIPGTLPDNDSVNVSS